MTPRAILFDFDGTLADSFDAITWSVNHVRSLHGLPLMPESEVKRLVGWGLPHLMGLVAPGVPVEQAVAEYRAHHGTVIESGTRLFPGVVDTLERLRTHAIRTAVCSNKSVQFTRELLEMLQIRDKFDAVLGPEDVGGRHKPAPDMLQEAMRRLGVAPTETLYIGDMSIDIETSRAAEVRVWVIPSGTQSAEDLSAMRPDRLLTTFPEVLTAISE